MSDTRTRALGLLSLLVLALVLCLGLLPYRHLLHIWPASTDGAIWATNGAWTNPGWFRWDFFSEQFVGYRPIMALSFTIDSMLGLFEPEPIRLSNMIAFGATGLALSFAAQALLGRKAPWMGILAAFLLVAHPSSEEIVPYEARRSYALAMAFGLASLIPWIAACKAGRWRSWQAWAGVLLLGFSLFSNEEGFVLVPIFPLLAWHFGPREIPARKRLLSSSALPMGLVLLAVAMRLLVLGHLGGYGKKFTSVERLWNILKSGVEATFFPKSVIDEPTLIPLGAIGVALLLGYYAWRGLLEPLWRLRAVERGELPRSRMLPLLPALWCGGVLLLSVATFYWYRRQAWCAAVPLALLYVVVLDQSIERWRARRWVLALHLLPQVLLLVPLLYRSPMLRGMRPAQIEAAQEHQRLLERALERLSALPERSQVFLVTPADKPKVGKRAVPSDLWYHGQRTSRWLGALLQDRGLRVQDLAFVVPESGDSRDLRLRFEMWGEHPTLLGEPGDRVVLSRPAARYGEVERDDDKRPRIPLDLLPALRGVRHHVCWFEGDEIRVQELELRDLVEESELEEEDDEAVTEE